jgi:hypothetical protein
VAMNQIPRNAVRSHVGQYGSPPSESEESSVFSKHSLVQYAGLDLCMFA